MQNSHNKISVPLLAITLASPLILWGILMLMPTFDDWTYMTTPYTGPVASADRLLPDGSYWRPFDGLFGSLLGIDYRMFPALNHIFVYAGHLACAFIVHRICGQLSMSGKARNIAVIYFFFSPAMLGTVLGIDSLNQVYSQLWGLAALTAYISSAAPGHSIRRTVIWLSLTLTATLSKENGIVWAVIPPITAFAFSLTNRKTLTKDIAAGILFCAAYMTARILLTAGGTGINSEYLSGGAADRLKDIATFIGMTWVPADYVSIAHPPSRNIMLAAVTLIMSVPFLWQLFIARAGRMRERQALSLALCTVIAASPHLLTLFSAMHSYAALGMSALLMAWLLSSHRQNSTAVTVTFAIYIAAAIFTDIRHWHKSYLSGLTGQDMAQEIISQTGAKPKSAYLIIIDKGEQKYSSFCVIPSDALGWGRAVQYRTGYEWPEELNDTTIKEADRRMIPSIAAKARKKGFEAVWIIEGKHARVMRQEKQQ